MDGCLSDREREREYVCVRMSEFVSTCVWVCECACK